MAKSPEAQMQFWYKHYQRKTVCFALIQYLSFHVDRVPKNVTYLCLFTSKSDGLNMGPW